MPFNVCLIGCGGQARTAYASPLRRYLAENAGVRLAACCDVRPDFAASLANVIHAEHTYTDFHAMLRAEQPDALLLVTPFTVTAAIARDVLARGIPALIEKPLGVNALEAQSIADVAAKFATPNQAAFNRRHMPLIRALRSAINGRPIQHMDYRMHRVRRTEAHFHTTAVHGLDLVGYLAGGNCVHMDCLYQPCPSLGEGVVNTQLLASYATGTTAAMSFCPIAGLVCEQLTVALADETMFVDLPVWGARGNPGLLEHYINGELVAHKTGLAISDGDSMPESNGFYWQLKSFLNAVRQGSSIADDVASGMDAMHLCDCIAQRHATYMPVR